MVLNGATTPLGWILVLVFSLREVLLNQVALAEFFHRWAILGTFTIRNQLHRNSKIGTELTKTFHKVILPQLAMNRDNLHLFAGEYLKDFVPSSRPNIRMEPVRWNCLINTSMTKH
jgi:hypothetical protein